MLQKQMLEALKTTLNMKIKPIWYKHNVFCIMMNPPFVGHLNISSQLFNLSDSQLNHLFVSTCKTVIFSFQIEINWLLNILKEYHRAILYAFSLNSVVHGIQGVCKSV